MDIIEFIIKERIIIQVLLYSIYFLNETQINITQLQNNQHKIKSYSNVIKVDNNALFSIRMSKTIDKENISFQGSSQNNLTLTKIGGV